MSHVFLLFFMLLAAPAVASPCESHQECPLSRCYVGKCVPTVAPEAWTKEVVLAHAQAAVDLELFTIPLYMSATNSILPTNQTNPRAEDIRNLVFTIALEEMLHLELTANLVAALGSTPNFTAPVFGQNVSVLSPYFDPATGDHGLKNATIRGMDKDWIKYMLDVEIPRVEEPLANHTTPNYRKSRRWWHTVTCACSVHIHRSVL